MLAERIERNRVLSILPKNNGTTTADISNKHRDAIAVTCDSLATEVGIASGRGPTDGEGRGCGHCAQQVRMAALRFARQAHFTPRRHRSAGDFRCGGELTKRIVFAEKTMGSYLSLYCSEFTNAGKLFVPFKLLEPPIRNRQLPCMDLGACHRFHDTRQR